MSDLDVPSLELGKIFPLEKRNRTVEGSLQGLFLARHQDVGFFFEHTLRLYLRHQVLLLRRRLFPLILTPLFFRGLCSTPEFFKKIPEELPLHVPGNQVGPQDIEEIIPVPEIRLFQAFQRIDNAG